MVAHETSLQVRPWDPTASGLLDSYSTNFLNAATHELVGGMALSSILQLWGKGLPIMSFRCEVEIASTILLLTTNHN